MFNTIRLIGTITRSIQVQSNKKFSPLGLGNNAFLYIIRAIEKPGMFLGELADALSIDRSTAFRSIKKTSKEQVPRLEIRRSRRSPTAGISNTTRERYLPRTIRV